MADWHDASAYEYFDELDVSGLAWECLRRNPRYRADYPMMSLGVLPVGEWGFDFPVDPELDARDAPVFWAPAAAPSVVSLMATLPAVGLGSLAREDLDTWRQVRADGLDWYRLDGHSLAIAVGDHGEPLGFLLPVDDAWSARLLAAERARLLLLGRSAPRYLTRQQGERIRGALRAIDGQDHGESYRAIATVFFGQKRIDAEHWKTSSLKARVARLVAHGRMLIARGYRQLLRGRLSKK